jgi:DNA polymerase I-like protein with 3'-5' exonuclease and polymerase domains
VGRGKFHDPYEAVPDVATSAAEYDPRALGASCDRCLLSQIRAGAPVPPENHNADRAIVGEAPGEDEVKLGRPYVGMSGKMLTSQLRAVGCKRNEINWLNAVACRPPDNDFERIVKRTQKLNKQIDKENVERAKNGQPLIPYWLHPVDACRNRLLKELGGVTDVIATGGKALKALTQTSASILAVRGGMIDGWLGSPDGDVTNFYRADGPWASQPPTHDARRLRVLPTVHPAFVLRSMRWMRPFRADLHRALRWFAGTHEWREPRIVYTPTPDELEAFLRALPIGTYDVETDGIEPLTARLRCIGVGNGDVVYLVPFLGIDGQSTFYSTHDMRRIKEIFRWWFTSKDHIKVGHNAGTYDRTIIEQHLGVTPAPLIDTILLHRLVESELPHNLGFVVSLYSELSPAWKADRTATTAETDMDLWKYCGYDVCNNDRILQPLVAHVRARNQWDCFKVDMKVQSICAEMHRVGMRVDQRRRAQHERLLMYGGYDPVEVEKWNKRVAKAKAAGAELPPDKEKPKEKRGAVSFLKELQDRTDDKKHNPNSVNQVRDLLYERWRLPIPDGSNGKPKITKGGDPSTDDEAIRALLVHPAVSEDIRAYLKALRAYRKRLKALGTYVLKLRPMDESAEDMEAHDEEDVGVEGGDYLTMDIDEYEEAEKKRKDRAKQREKKRGIVFPDGRMHPSYNPHVAVTGRLSSSRPNAQNFPADLRDMIIAAAGHVLVGADADQLELRVGAAHWRAEAYLEAFRLLADPHATTSLLVFRDKFTKAAGFPPGVWQGNYFIPTGEGKWGGLAKAMRDLAKKVQYASQYWATVETVWRIITSSEDKEGNLIYANLSLAEVRDMCDAWLQGAPEIPAGWEADMAFFQKHGYMAEPILNRRRDFLDGENKNEIVNYGIQAAGASHMNLAMVELVEKVPLNYAGPETGLINQCHDSLVLEVPEADAPRVAGILEACMTREYESMPGVKLTAKAQIANNWKDA